MHIVALIVVVSATLASIVVAAMTLRAMAQDTEELSAFVGFAHLPRRD